MSSLRHDGLGPLLSQVPPGLYHQNLHGHHTGGCMLHWAKNDTLRLHLPPQACTRLPADDALAGG